ncbi:MAG: hypothetical protein HFI69_08095 [Lachnospiraceae bacterium]|nr:hypothetical protein [Lachnospiraceae bacterium]
MKKIIRKICCILTTAAVAIGGIQQPEAALAQEGGYQQGISPHAEDEGVTVYTREDFMNALKQHQSPITVATHITIGQDVDTDKRMLPVKIPGNTLIRGTENSSISARSPIQLEGDGVCFQNIKMMFESSTALGSVPHREIFLAGHSLTMDNVDTYHGGQIGMGDTEDELLPTVYAGGYSNTAVGDNASLTVINSNDKTMFQEICMGNGKGTDNKVPYYGNAVLNLDAKPIVRDGVDTALNSQAEINITAEENKVIKTKKFYGNDNTTLTLNQASMEDAELDGVGNIVLKDKASITPLTQQFKNITLVNGACLDLSKAGNARISGDFTGAADAAAQRGILVLNAEGSLTIEGKVTGTTQFQTGHRLFPGYLLSEKSYIFARDSGGAEPNFLLAQKNIDNGYELKYENGAWKVYGQPIIVDEIGRIEIVSAPFKADLRKIPYQEDGSVPDENVFFEVNWYDLKGEKFSDADILEYHGFYEVDYVIRIRTDYWQSDAEDLLDKTDWYQSVSLLASEEHPGKYFLQAFDGATPGDYTFLFCSEPFDDLATVGDVKALKGTVMAEKRVIFYNEDQQEPQEPDHTHTYQSTITREPACTEAGIRTFTCNCGEKYTEKIAALGHTEVTDPRVEPTETEAGKTEGSHCEVCGEVLKAQETIPATGKPGEHQHSYESQVTKEASCTETGERTYTCECGETYTEEIAALGHIEVTDPGVEPTETEAGKTEGSHCGVCGEVLKAQETIPATGKPGEHQHSYESQVTKEATCTETGERTYTCECGETYTEEIAAFGHTEVTDPRVEPTETEAGKTEGSHCGVCGEVLKAQETIPATGKPGEHQHSYESQVTKEATCKEAGVRTYTCECGETYTEQIAVLEHQYVEECIPATVNSSGKMQQVCRVCSEIRNVSVIDSPQKAVWNKTDFTYDGKVKKPAAAVKDSKGKILTAGTDYKVFYPKGSKNPGIYTVTIEFQGKYSGTISESYTIRPKKTSLKKVTAKSKGIRATWKKQTSQTDGYEIQCCTSKNFKGRTLKKSTAKKSVTVKNISGLKGKKKYFVRIRTYKNVKVNGKSKKLYSDWSGIKTVRTKK